APARPEGGGGAADGGAERGLGPAGGQRDARNGPPDRLADEPAEPRAVVAPARDRHASVGAGHSGQLAQAGADVREEDRAEDRRRGRESSAFEVQLLP